MVTQTIDINTIERLSPENLGIIQSLIQQMTGGISPRDSCELGKPAPVIPHRIRPQLGDDAVNSTVIGVKYYLYQRNEVRRLRGRSNKNCQILVEVLCPNDKRTSRTQQAHYLMPIITLIRPFKAV